MNCQRGSQHSSALLSCVRVQSMYPALQRTCCEVYAVRRQESSIVVKTTESRRVNMTRILLTRFAEVFRGLAAGVFPSWDAPSLRSIQAGLPGASWRLRSRNGVRRNVQTWHWPVYFGRCILFRVLIGMLRGGCGVGYGGGSAGVGVGTRWAHDGERAGRAEFAGGCSGVSAQWTRKRCDGVDGAGAGPVETKGCGAGAGGHAVAGPLSGL